MLVMREQKLEYGPIYLRNRSALNSIPRNRDLLFIWLNIWLKSTKMCFPEEFYLCNKNTLKIVTGIHQETLKMDIGLVLWSSMYCTRVRLLAVKG